MNINVVCPHCLKVNSVEKKESYTTENCRECNESLLDSKPLAANLVILDYFITTTELPVIVDFWAPWCGPCKMIAPVLEELDGELGDKVKIVKVDVDENQETAGKFGVMSIPTLLVLKNGEVVDTIVGFQPKEALAETLNKHL